MFFIRVGGECLFSVFYYNIYDVYLLSFFSVKLVVVVSSAFPWVFVRNALFTIVVERVFLSLVFFSRSFSFTCSSLFGVSSV